MASIFVAKLDFGVSDEELKELFAQYGTVAKSHIAKDKETGKPRGFAFVEMSSDEETSSAINGLDGHSINGREIVVKLAEDRSNSKPQRRSPDDNRSSRGDGPSRPTYTPPAPKEDSPFQNEKSEGGSSSEPAKKAKRGNKSTKKKSSGDSASDSRENKMSAYKKSGKKSNFTLDDDDDWEMELLKSKKRGWEDDEDEDEDF